jgi:hypothetical protein|tara:strand:+ start:19269 stop:19745 length:477 start_codon:yes stop_codon:yes gene_type:complete
MMKNYEYMDNAFWEDGAKTIMKCIRLTKRPEGGKKKDVLTLKATRDDGTLCPQFREVIDTFGIDKINANTDERVERKEQEEREKRAVHEARKKSAELEMLFNMKLQAFEIEEIKNAKDRNLRAKLRRAKNVVELNALAAIVIGNELGYFKKVEDESTN